MSNETKSNQDFTAPPGHTWVSTDDGSKTLFSEAFQEACHSTSGARAETVLHYLGGCKIKQKAQTQNSLTILEVGFGLGIGFELTREYLLEDECQLNFVSVEIDQKLVEWYQQNHPELPWKWNNNVLEAITSTFHLIILVGDARKTLPAFCEAQNFKWDAIYQDAFSPKRNPVLWTKEWFELLKKYSSSEVILSTYSSSVSIRKSLYETGWILHSGEKFGKKRTSTRATLRGMSDPEILKSLELSPTQSLTDLNIQVQP